MISSAVLRPQRFLLYIGLLSLTALLLVEPYVRDYDSEQVTFLSKLLAVWIGLALLVFILNIRKIAKNTRFIVGLATVFLLTMRALLFTDNFVFELLPISYSMIFMCTVLISQKTKIQNTDYEKIVKYFVLASCAGMLYANGLAFGIVGDAEVIPAGRYSGVLDGNTAVLSIVVAMAAYLYYPARLMKAVAAVTILLALMRLISFGSKGPLVASLIIICLEVILFQRKGKRLNGLLLISAVMMSGLLIINLLAPIGAYFDILTARFDSSDTWIARLSEAENDFNAFLERPLLGWGRDVPGFNVLDESSSGHITVTGMLARMGFVGTLGLSYFYVSYFIQLKRQIGREGDAISIKRVIFRGTMIFVVFLLVLGNPLFLFPPWAFLPLLFPAISSTR